MFDKYLSDHNLVQNADALLLDTGCKLNVRKTFKSSFRRLLNVLRTLNLHPALNPLSVNPTIWSNKLCVFDHFVGLALKGLST